MTETLDEIRALLDDGKGIPTRSANRLTLAAIADLTDEVGQLVQIEQANKTQIDALTKRINELEERDIILWVQQHPRGAALLVVLTVIFVMFWRDNYTIIWNAFLQAIP